MKSASNTLSVNTQHEINLKNFIEGEQWLNHFDTFFGPKNKN